MRAAPANLDSDTSGATPLAESYRDGAGAQAEGRGAAELPEPVRYLTRQSETDSTVPLTGVHGHRPQPFE